ncbi:hypothetical protein Tco_0693557 [Tanacetum coccineum]
MEVEDDVVGDLGEPANYKTAMLDPDKVIWQGAMDEEMNSMKVNEVWTEERDNPPKAKIVRNTKEYVLVYRGHPDTEHELQVPVMRPVNAIKMIQSQTGFMFFVVVNGGAVDLESKKHTTIARHATQSEYNGCSQKLNGKLFG